MAQVHGATYDVAADQVGVHFFEGGRGENVTGEDAVPESRSETLYLRFEGFQHVNVGAVGDVAVGPGDVLPCWSAGGIEEGGLGQKDKRPLSVAAVAHRVFGRGDLLESTAEMNGGSPTAIRGFPRNGAV